MSFLPYVPFAHALVAKQDLPIPAWLFAWAASIVLDRLLLRPLRRLAQAALRGANAGALRPPGSRAPALGRPRRSSAAALGVFLLGVAVYAGIHGTEAPDRNFAITFFFVTAWIGFPFFSALFGNFFRALQPLARDRPRRRRRLPARRRPAPPPTSPTRSGSAAGPPRPACSASSGSRSSTAPAAASRSASNRTPPASPPASTPATRWR